VALVFQEPEHQILGVTVREDAAFGPRAAGEKAEAYLPRVDAALERTGLSGYGDRLCAGLSGGEKRRLAIASALVAEPELLALDEPFNGLDWSGASALLSTLLRLRAAGVGILIVTHVLEKCLAHAERLVVMDSGAVVRDGTPESLWDELPSLGLRRPPGGIGRLAEMSWLEGAR
jgi:energy-coupling factor transporter ATP-binding protein EcfA2